MSPGCSPARSAEAATGVPAPGPSTLPRPVSPVVSITGANGAHVAYYERWWTPALPPSVAWEIGFLPFFVAAGGCHEATAPCPARLLLRAPCRSARGRGRAGRIEETPGGLATDETGAGRGSHPGRLRPWRAVRRGRGCPAAQGGGQDPSGGSPGPGPRPEAGRGGPHVHGRPDEGQDRPRHLPAGGPAAHAVLAAGRRPGAPHRLRQGKRTGRS